MEPVYHHPPGGLATVRPVSVMTRDLPNEGPPVLPAPRGG